MRYKKSLLWITSLLILLFVVKAQAAPLIIEITQGIEDATPIAIVPFNVEGGKPPPADLAAIVSADLRRSGQFKPLAVGDMLEKPSDPTQIKYPNWRLLDIEHVVVGNVKYVANGNRYEASFWIVDVFKANSSREIKVAGTVDGFRAIAHSISDVIYEQLTGVRGAFSTYIAYVTAEGNLKSRRYELVTADSDGENAHAIFNSTFPIMSPMWSPDRTKIAYASLEENGHQLIYIQEWLSGKKTAVGNTVSGLYGAPAWSPDGKELAMAVGKDGNTEIYVIDLATKKKRQLTRHWAIDTEPTWTPDGKSIIFTSDRGGQPQLYKVAARGGREERLTFEGRENARASVSPDGKLVAMVHSNSGRYQIAVMELSTGNLRVLTDGTLDESPSFAPNGTMIIYATTSGDRGVLAAVSVDGRVQQKLSSENDVREPAWSPFNNK